MVIKSKGLRDDGVELDGGKGGSQRVTPPQAKPTVDEAAAKRQLAESTPGPMTTGAKPEAAAPAQKSVATAAPPQATKAELIPSDQMDGVTRTRQSIAKTAEMLRIDPKAVGGLLDTIGGDKALDTMRTVARAADTLNGNGIRDEAASLAAMKWIVEHPTRFDDLKTAIKTRNPGQIKTFVQTNK